MASLSVAPQICNRTNPSIEEISNNEDTHEASEVPIVVFDSDKTSKVASHSRNGFMVCLVQPADSYRLNTIYLQSSKISKIRGLDAVSTTPAAKKERADDE